MNIKSNIDIVDDDSMLRELFSAFAESVGFTAKTYYSAEHYLEYSNSTSYTPPTLAVVTDIRMPGKSGYELMSDIRKINPLQRFVVITGTAEDGINKDVRACFYLSKSEHPLCKSLNDLGNFNITDWSCPLENIATH